MAELRPFRALRYDPAHIDLSLAIAPPYDVISPQQQAELYDREPHNIIRIEYGREQPGDGEGSNKYTRARDDLRAWRAASVLRLDDKPAIYVHRQQFEWDRGAYSRLAYFGAVRLEEWDKGVIKPHEHTLSNPKADRMNLLRATRTQVSPVYSLFRARGAVAPAEGEIVARAEADRQQHTLERISDAASIGAIVRAIAEADVYIADGHHRYETALAYRDEVRARAATWTGDEPENFVLMALTSFDDPGLLVLPTHRLIHLPSLPDDALSRIGRHFDISALDGSDARSLLVALAEAGHRGSSFVVGGLDGGPHLLTLRHRGGVEGTMPEDQSGAWKRLDVNVLQYGILQDVFGIDDARLKAGGAVTYIQSADEALAAARTGEATVAFLLNATPIEQILAVSDVNGRMPQKSTYFQPKLPTGLVLRPFD